jgi:hypothetical protein
MTNPENQHRPLIRADIIGEGSKWIDPKLLKDFDYDPQTIELGGEETFIRIMHYAMRLMGLGTSLENNFEWGARTYNGYWCDPDDVDNFPLSEPGPGRVRVPVYGSPRFAERTSRGPLTPWWRKSCGAFLPGTRKNM